MSDLVFDAPPRPTLAVAGTSARFPIRRVFCIGRNYAAHAREMGRDPQREPPFFFMKPADAVVAAEGVLPYPPQTAQLHHEVELVVALGPAAQGAVDVTPAKALGLVWGYGAGVDLTRRDLQDEAKALSRPWDAAKGFDASGPCSPLVPAVDIGHPAGGRIWLDVNERRAQTGDLAEMIWPVADILAHLSRSMALAPGDLVFTGTPAGVGPVAPGDRLRGGVDGVAAFDFRIGSPQG